MLKRTKQEDLSYLTSKLTTKFKKLIYYGVDIKLNIQINVKEQQVQK